MNMSNTHTQRCTSCRILRSFCSGPARLLHGSPRHLHVRPTRLQPNRAGKNVSCHSKPIPLLHLHISLRPPFFLCVCVLVALAPASFATNPSYWCAMRCVCCCVFIMRTVTAGRPTVRHHPNERCTTLINCISLKPCPGHGSRGGAKALWTSLNECKSTLRSSLFHCTCHRAHLRV